MIERISRYHYGQRRTRLAARRQLQQRLRSLGRQMVCQSKQRVRSGLLDVAEPLLGHAVTEKLVVGHFGENALFLDGRLRRGDDLGLHVDRDHDLLDRLAYLDQLRRARFRMRLKFAALRPVISIVVVADVAEQKARIVLCERSVGCRCSPAPTRSSCPSPYRAYESSCRIGRVELEVKRCRLYRLLLIAGQPR